MPKLFYREGHPLSDKEAAHIQRHVLWWLSYCRKIKFPNYQASQSDTQSDFFEVLIYLFAKYTRNLLNNSVYQQYEEESRETAFIKGRLNTSEYIQDNVSRGRWHKLNCTYDAFLIDNEFNRIIKYVATLLFRVSKQAENKKHLREILFMLDEVTDSPATAKQCERIRFNPMFSEFETVRDYCNLFLSNSISFDYKNELKLFAFLLPMEYVFEDFIYGFVSSIIIYSISPLSSLACLSWFSCLLCLPSSCLPSLSRDALIDDKIVTILSIFIIGIHVHDAVSITFTICKEPI